MAGPKWLVTYVVWILLVEKFLLKLNLLAWVILLFWVLVCW